MSSRVTPFRGSSRVEKGDDHQHGAENEERQNAVSAIEGRKVEEKNFEHDQAKECERLPAEQRRFLLDADENQNGRVNRPQHGEREVTREVGVDSSYHLSEVIPKFQRKSDEREYVNQNGKNAEFVLLLFTGVIQFVARRPKRDAEAGDNEEIRSKALIDEECAGGRRENEHTDRGDREKQVAELAQKAAGGAEAGPDENGAFDGEAERDPFSVEADRNRHRGESEAHSRVEISRERTSFFPGVRHHACDGDVSSGQRENQQREGPAVVGPEERVEGADVGECVDGRHENVDLAHPAFLHGAKSGQGGEEQKEQCGEYDRAFERLAARAVIKLGVPAPIINFGCDEGDRRERIPIFALAMTSMPAPRIKR